MDRALNYRVNARRLGRAALCALALLALAERPYAQTPPTPGSVMESLTGPRPSIPPTPAQIILPEQPGPSIHDRKGKRFQVHSFRFVGNTAFPAQRL